jgi:uncharacterized membrane protein
MVDPSLLGRIVVLGVAAGMRSLLPLAFLAWLAPPVGWLATLWARGILGLAAAAELVSDKLPATPSRLRPAPLIGRLVLGGLVGGLSMVQADASIWMGAVLGALASAGGSFGGNKLRGQLVRRSGKPDLWFALLEDATAIALCLWAILGPLGPR